MKVDIRLSRPADANVSLDVTMTAEECQQINVELAALTKPSAALADLRSALEDAYFRLSMVISVDTDAPAP